MLTEVEGPRDPRSQYLKIKKEYELYKTNRIKDLVNEYYEMLLRWGKCAKHSKSS